MAGAVMWAGDLGPYGVTLTFGDDAARIALSGQVDVATGSALIDAATSAVARYAVVEMDLSGVTFIDSIGLRALLKVKRFADAYDTTVAFVAVSSPVRATIGLAGLADQFGELPAG